jgi:hypothetical protein
MQVLMLEVYGTRIGGLIIVHCEILHLSVISMNRGLVFASKIWFSLAGLLHAVARVEKLRCALL